MVRMMSNLFIFVCSTILSCPCCSRNTWKRHGSAKKKESSSLRSLPAESSKGRLSSLSLIRSSSR